MREKEEEVVLQENAIQIAMNAGKDKEYYIPRKDKEYYSPSNHFPSLLFHFFPLWILFLLFSIYVYGL